MMQLSLNGSGAAGSTVPTSAFFGTSLKKVASRFPNPKVHSRSFKVVAQIDEDKQTEKDNRRGLAYDTSDDQQDITRGKGMVDSLFQAPMGSGTRYAVMSSYDYISTGLRTYLENSMDGFYIAPAFMDKLVVHINKNSLTSRLQQLIENFLCTDSFDLGYLGRQRSGKKIIPITSYDEASCIASNLEGEVALPEVVKSPDAYDSKKGNTSGCVGGGRSGLQFEDYVHSYLIYVVYSTK
ncbi:hypothetical protein QYF36_010249 [Acer negundo]|nr:hypothetical protein QYF36_010249 [Acer negundo]